MCPARLSVYAGAGNDVWTRAYNLSGMGNADPDYDPYETSTTGCCCTSAPRSEPVEFTRVRDDSMSRAHFKCVMYQRGPQWMSAFTSKLRSCPSTL